MEEIKSDDVSKLFRGRMGLILGPGITKFPGSLNELSEQLAQKWESESGGSYIETCETLIEKGVEESEIRGSIREGIAKQKRSALLTHLAKTRWSAVLSASLDSEFEDSFRLEANQRIAWPTITVLPDLTISPPPGTVPVYKLLGLASRDDFAYSDVLYIARRSTWRHAVKGFADLVRGNPVLCVGMSDCPSVLLDLIGEMLGDPSAIPSCLLLLAEDPLCANPQLPRLLRTRGRLAKVQCTIGDVARAIVDGQKPGHTSISSSHVGTQDLYHELHSFRDMVTVVNEQLTPTIPLAERNRLMDLLFSPSVPNWDPVAYDLDFGRTVTSPLLNHLVGILQGRAATEGAVVVVGAASTGKSMILKRLAWEAAKATSLVLWVKPWFYHDPGQALSNLFRAVGKIVEKSRKRVLVVMDDPATFGSLTPREVVTAARSANLSILLLVGIRSSEWGTVEHRELVGGLPIVKEQVIADELDESEWLRLAGYLKKIGIATDQKDAETRLAEAANRAASDTLSTLYWLLPETRANIASSIRNEYHRLGDMAGLRNVIIGSIKHSTELLQRAYEMVAVADHYRAAIPLEVLVSALGVDYGTWRDATRPESAAWGLFYDTNIDEDGNDTNEEGTLCFHVRNAVVTRLIVEAVNGGSIGHSGEVRVLHSLLSACTGRSHSVYREFCVRILVPHHKIKRLAYEEGLSLYDAAILALPHPDRTLVHQKGLWIKNVGQNPALAKSILTKALSTSIYPYASRGEAEEHIYTSLAATTLEEVDRKLLPLAEGKREILEHLGRARENGFFNAKAVHVQANLILRLAGKEQSVAAADYLTLINKAVADIDLTVLMLQGQAKESREAVNDLAMLEQIRGVVLAKTLPLEDLKAVAQTNWDQSQSQEGFVLVGRKLFADALARDKRYNIAFDQCVEYMEIVKAAGVAVLPALFEAALHIYYHWQVRGGVRRGVRCEVHWGRVKELASGAMRSAQSARVPLLRHILALSHAHLGEWAAANAIYAQLRQEDIPNHVKFAGRDYLLDAHGAARMIQGTIRLGADREFLNVEELGIDPPADRRGQWPRAGEIAHAYLRFSFAGPMAVNHVDK